MYRIAIINQFKSLVEPLTLSNETFELCLALSSGLCLTVFQSDCRTVNPGSAFHAPCGTFVCTMPCLIAKHWPMNEQLNDCRQLAPTSYQYLSA